MIELTKLNKKKFLLNSELIETIESTPDTVITLRNGKLLIVVEPPEKIAELVLGYQRKRYKDMLSSVVANTPISFAKEQKSQDSPGGSEE